MKFYFFTLLFTAVIFSTSAIAQTTSNVNTNSTSDSTVNTDAESRTIVISPPPSAISPSVGSSSSDLCTVGISGAVQTQILGISTGEMVRDANCERLKISKQIVNDNLCRTKQQKKQKNIIFRNNINDGYKSKSVLGLF